MTEIVRVPSKIEFAKRTYVPYVVRDACPNCGKPHEVDLRQEHHLISPQLGVPTLVYYYCGYCEHEWQVRVVLDVTLTVAP